MTVNDVAILFAACASVLTSIVALAGLMQGRANARQAAATHSLVDGKMTQLLQSTQAIGVANAGQAHAEGVIEGAQGQRDRDTPSPESTPPASV
jgi:hypothetical protein